MVQLVVYTSFNVDIQSDMRLLTYTQQQDGKMCTYCAQEMSDCRNRVRREASWHEAVAETVRWCPRD